MFEKEFDDQEGVLDTHLREVINKSWNFAGRCKTYDDHVQNAVLGLVGEAGETADQVKKWLYHTEKPGGHHEAKLKSELGDVIYYWRKLVELCGFTVEEVLATNKEKLESRHPELGKVSERFGNGYIK
jgi:NTP pyrophosphatase (non-canonical NTP hydrolase)